MSLERPPNATCRLEARNFDTRTFLAIIENAINELDSQHALRVEAAVLSRMIYRMKSKFRNDKGLKSMERVNRALLNYLSLHLEKEYENLQSYVEIGGKIVVLPSKQMLQYILVRTQGFAKLMACVEEVARCTAHFFKTRITTGHAWTISIIAYAVVGRIWILARHLVKKSCSWYNCMLPYVPNLKPIGSEWLSKGDRLPSNLQVWLALPWINEELPEVPNNEKLRGTMFKLITSCSDRTKQNSPSHFQEPKEKSQVVSAFSTKTDGVSYAEIKKDKVHGQSDDIGELIDRSTAEHRSTRGAPSINKSKYGREGHGKKRTVAGSSSSLEIGRTESELTMLLDKDSYPGLDKLQWNIIRKKSRKLLSKLSVCSDKKKQALLFNKAVRQIRHWIRKRRHLEICYSPQVAQKV
ncbi:hypothetical protein KM043_003090 [Ampulex compressa]|nr:hypothetical protein KM043_003090 [Ampulex compressa]